MKVPGIPFDVPGNPSFQDGAVTDAQTGEQLYKIKFTDEDSRDAERKVEKIGKTFSETVTQGIADGLARGGSTGAIVGGAIGSAVRGGFHALGQPGAGVGDFLTGAEKNMSAALPTIGRALGAAGGPLGAIGGGVAGMAAQAFFDQRINAGAGAKGGAFEFAKSILGDAAFASGIAGNGDLPKDLINSVANIGLQGAIGEQRFERHLRAALGRFDAFSLGMDVMR